jgi:hypothetical protein
MSQATSGPPRAAREALPPEGSPAVRTIPAKAPGKRGPDGPLTPDFAALVAAGAVTPLPAAPAPAPAPRADGVAPPSIGRPEAPRAPRDPGAREIRMVVQEGPAAPNPALRAAVAKAPEAAAPPGTPAPAPPPVLADRNLSGAVLPHAAHLSLDTREAGAIGLHLRIRDGVADLRIDGTVAERVEARSAELRLALAREGLQLGTLELSAGTGDRCTPVPSAGTGDSCTPELSAGTGDPSHPGHRGEADRPDSPGIAPPRGTKAAPGPEAAPAPVPRRGDGRGSIHVEA